MANLGCAGCLSTALEGGHYLFDTYTYMSTNIEEKGIIHMKKSVSLF
jgi:hypothetical protein